MNLRSEELDLDAIRSARIFWTTGTGLSDEPSRTATLGPSTPGPDPAITIHDLDYRPMFWKHPAEASKWQRQALERVTIAIGNLEECAVAVGRDPRPIWPNASSISASRWRWSRWARPG